MTIDTEKGNFIINSKDLENFQDLKFKLKEVLNTIDHLENFGKVLSKTMVKVNTAQPRKGDKNEK